MLVGFSLKPITLGLPFLLFVGIIFRKFSTSTSYGLLEKGSLLNLGVAIIFLPLTLIISFTGAVEGFLVEYLGVFSFFVFKDLRIDERRKKVLIVAMLASLFLSVVYGIYEYFFARFDLVDWLVAHSSNTFVNGSIPVSDSFKRVTEGVFYRSQSFELDFLSFGYQGFFLCTVLLGILLFYESLRRRIWIAIATILSFIGMFTSLTFSAVGMFITGFFYYLLNLHGFRRIKRISLASIIALFILAMILSTIPDVRDTLNLALKFNSVGAKLGVHAGEGRFENAHVMDYILIGRGTATASTSQRWFPLEWFVENQYLATIVETGLIGLVTYLIFMISIYAHLRKMKKKLHYGTLDYALVICLMWIWVFYVVVGFVHGSWGNNIDFMFMGLVGLISNRYTRKNDIPPAAIPARGDLMSSHGLS